MNAASGPGPVSEPTIGPVPQATFGPVPEPTIGAVVVDEAQGRVGQLMDREGGLFQLRPLSGGREWDADPARVRPATPAERLRAGVAAANAASRGAVQ